MHGAPLPPSSFPPWPPQDHRTSFNQHPIQYNQHFNHHDPPFNYANNNYYHPNPNPTPTPPPPPPPIHPPPPPPPHPHPHPHPEYCNYPQEYPQQHRVNGDRSQASGGGGFGSNYGNSMPFSGRKRFRHHSNGASSANDHIDATGIAKLYVAQVPRTATEEHVRPLFEKYGHIVEIVILKDKRTGHQQGSCFVKYSNSDEADRAIKALDNQHTFPGEVVPVNVKYADGERERLGSLDKLYVGGLNRDTTKRDIEEVFSPYGLIEDIYIVRDELKQSRGCGFVRFSRGEMALAAIRALNGIFIMRGCDQPLSVRFAEPKKPRIGEPRGNNTMGNLNLGPRSQDPFVRPGGSFHNNSFPIQQNITSSQSQAVCQMVNQEPAAPCPMQQSFPPPHKAPPQFAQMSSEQAQIPPGVCQSARPPLPDVQKQAHSVQARQDLHLKQSSEVKEQELSHTGHNPHTVTSAPSSPVASVVPQTTSSLECDWSEHTCPDGDKYYYNCVTCESRWEKPEDFALFEQQQQKQQKLQDSQKLYSQSSVLSSQELQFQTQNFHQKLQLQQPSSAAIELDHVQQQSKASSVISLTCV